ncbi:MAG TPA: response regulator [Opitutaceae bacterium]|nr:response regulator [Opitutaceae bacterium]
MALILVIDDEELICQVIARSLRLHGHQVVTACGGEEGLDHFQKQHFDLVITDVRMPGLNGPAVIHEVRALRPETRVIIMGGDGSVAAFGIDAFAQRVGADRVLHKPFGTQELNAMVTQLLATPGAGSS